MRPNRLGGFEVPELSLPCRKVATLRQEQLFFFVAVAAVVNPNGIRTLLANGVSTLLITV